MTSARESGGVRLLVVEDEEHLAAGLKMNFELEGYGVDVATSARDARQALLTPEPYGAIVLDVMLPDIDGFELCRSLRKAGNYTPVVMLTARAAPEDRVLGLEVGADDYLVKPFELEELLARVRSVLRRRRWDRAGEVPARRTVEFGAGRCVVDFDTYEVRVEGESRRLTRLELDLLAYFSENPGRVLSRDKLLERVWNLRNYPNTRTVDNFIVRLRRHFELDPQAPRHFLSIRGAGYRFLPEPEPDRE